MSDELTIDPEFESLLGGLTAMQQEELESLLDDEGWRSNERIIVWANHNDTIVDGHNRYRICKRLGIKFKTVARTFASREDVKKWMYRNQAGRRNITQEELSYIRGKVYDAEKMTASEVSEAGVAARQSTMGQIDPRSKDRTSARIANEFNVSEKTIRRDAAFARKVDEEVAKVPDDQKAAKKAELLRAKDKRKGKTKNAKKQVADMNWNKALAKAAKRVGAIGKEDFTQLLGINDTVTARKGLSVLAQSKGFIVERNGSADSYRISRAFVMPVDSDETPPDLLRAIKARALKAKEDLLDGNNAAVRWSLCVDFANDLLTMLKDVK